MKLSRKWILIASLVLSVAMATSGTMAYLTSTDNDVNVMTLGNVKIEQIEQQRKGPGNLEDFQQNKPLLPTTDTAKQWLDLNGKLMNNSNDNAYKFLADADGNNLSNAIDKIVTVKNTGKSDAYVRTIFAFEVAETVAEVRSEKTGHTPTHIGLTRNATYGRPDNYEVGTGNTDWVWTWLGDVVTISGQKYAIATATHEKVLTPGATTIPSLLQVYMKSIADNDYVAKLGDTYEILVVSQAVQAAGFENATTALNEAFGEVSAASHPWLDMDGTEEGDQDPDGVVIPTYVSTVDELKKAIETGGNITLTDDLELDGSMIQLMDTVSGSFTTAQSMFSAIGNKDVTIDLNGKTLSVDTAGGTNVWTIFYAGEGAKLTVKGGRIEFNSQGRSAGTAAFTNFGSNSVITIKDVEVEQIGAGGVTQMIYAHGAPQDLGKIYVEGGTYIQKMPTSATNPFYEQGGVNTNIFVSGGTYKVYHNVDLTQYMTLADGYELQQTHADADGAMWYTVVKK